MLSESKSSNFSEALLSVNKLEKNFLKTQLLSSDHDRTRIRSNSNRRMDTFLQITRKRHEIWYRYDKYFREALKKEKDRHEKRKIRLGSRTDLHHKRFPSLVTLNLRSDPMTKTEQRTYQVLQASQKLLDESARRSNFTHSRPSTSLSTSKHFTTSATRSSCTYNSPSFLTPMTQSIDDEEYIRLMNESLQSETYANFVDHFIKFRPEFREQFSEFHRINRYRNAVDKLKTFNQMYTKRKDQRYHNLINSLADLHVEKQKNK